jgi:hypothetical protein
MSDVFRFSIAPTILSWTSTSFLCMGLPYVGLLGVDFEEKLERKLVYGMKRNGKPLGKTGGKYTPGPLKTTMLAETWAIMSKQLAVAGLGSIGDAKIPGTKGVPLIVKHEEPQDPTGIAIITFEECGVAGVSDSYAEGNEELKVDVSWDLMGIRRNGLTLYSVQKSLGL